MKKIIFSLLLSGMYFIASSQSFSAFNSNVVNVYFSNVSWCDFDFDGDYDFIISGCRSLFTLGNSYGGITVIYKNQGDEFVVFDTLNYYEKGGLKIRDFNSDNVNDVVSTGFVSISGTEVERYSDIYLNFSGFDFDIDNTAGLTGLSNGPATTGDLDNDGDIDLVLYGRDINNIYGIRTFLKTDNGYELYELPYSSEMSEINKIEIVDINNDGSNDILFCGNNLQSGIFDFKIYKNNGNLDFNLLESIVTLNYTPFYFSIGDINYDGLFDVVISGRTSTYPNYIPNISPYINNGNFQFESLSGFSIPAFSDGDMAFGDVNNDGQSDILLTGQTGVYNSLSKLYINNNGVFQAVNSLGLPSLSKGSSSFVDFDNDGDLDFLICGFNYANQIIETEIYQNNLISKGEVPVLHKPLNLDANISSDGITFSWDPVLTPTPHTYNLRVGTYPGGCDIVSPGANIETGKMQSPEYGNVGFNTSYTIRNLFDGIYYWSVQAVNAAFQSSMFSPEENIYYSRISDISQNDGVFLSSNPLTDFSYLLIMNHTDGLRSELKIYSIDGKLIKDESFVENKFFLNQMEYGQGIFFYELKHSGKTYTGNFAVIH